MSTDRHYITVSGLEVEVVHKDIKNLHVGVYPPHGRIRVAVPLRLTETAVRLAVISRLRWIKRQKAGFVTQQRESPREMVSGESHFYMGRRYRLRFIQATNVTKIALRGRSYIELHAKSESSSHHRELMLHRWYRERLREQIPSLIEKWEPILGVKVAEWGIKKMKTRWGTCNAEARRIWLNLELAKKQPQCLEYIVVHEMVHLLERPHSDRFHGLLNRFLPNWQQARDVLNRAPLAFDKWK